MDSTTFSEAVLALECEVSHMHASLVFVTLTKNGEFVCGAEGASLEEALNNARVGATWLESQAAPAVEEVQKPARRARGGK